MRKIITAAALLCLLISCNKTADKTEPQPKATVKQLITKEDLVPKDKTTETFDTIIASKNLKISIEKIDLDSYVLQEYKDADTIHRDKYRDVSAHLTIKQNGQTILDTNFTKENFLKDYPELIKTGTFGYWLSKIDGDKIKFSAGVYEPETDVGIDFNHIFDLKTRKFQIVEETADEEGE